ncbi:hypothetical protein [Streptomyces sp. NPDC048623]|uniref:hypothetical protein n=1 Tax=Streptomyces sp. NPDC048623 TaxID=3155761 RepID=UPI003437C3AB
MQRARLRAAGRLGPVLAVLFMLAVPLAGTAQAAPDPCAPLKGTPSYEYCKAGGAGQGGQGGNKGGADKEKEDPCALIKGQAKTYCEGGVNDTSSYMPGPGEILDDTTGACKPPAPESPNEGAATWFDSGPAKAPAPRDPDAGHLYEQYGFAGMSWNNYQLACITAGGAIGNVVEPAAESWLANTVFGITKSWTAFTVSLRQQATGDTDFLDELDPVITQATRAVRDAVYNNWIGASLVALGAVIVFQARNKDTSGVVSQVGWALLVMALATGVASYPVQASSFADDALSTVTSNIDQAFADVDLSGKPQESGATTAQASASTPANPTTAHGNMLVHHVLYQHWLRGELGSTDSEVAKHYGPELLDAQALTWAEDRLPPKERAAVVQKKQEKYKGLALAIKNQDPQAYRHLTGEAGGRNGQAWLSLASAASTNLFSNAADLVIISGKIMIRFVIVLLPAIAVIGLHRRMAGAVKTGLHSIMAACINIPLFSAAAAVDALAIRSIQDQTSINPWMKVLLLLVITWALWRMVKPLRRLSSMANPNQNWVEGAGSIAGSPAKVAKTLGKAYILRRALRRMGTNAGKAGAQEVLDETEDDTTETGRTQGNGSGGHGPVDPGSWDEWTNDHDAIEPPSRRAHDNVLDADSWYVADLEHDRRETRAIAPAPVGYGRQGPDWDNLAVSGAPFVPGPLPGGAGAAAAVPAPRAQASSHTEIPTRTQRAALPSGSGPRPTTPAAADRPYAEPSPSGVVPATEQSAAPAAAQAASQAPAAERPFAEPTAPVVVPPTIEADGNHVYVLYDPAADGFAVQDNRVDAPEEDGR